MSMTFELRQCLFLRRGKLMESTEEKKLVSQGSGPAEAGSREAESSAEKKERGPVYPVRPLEPDCVIYLRTGNCRYGSGCRFNHPVKKKVKLENPSKAAAQASSTSSSPKGTVKHSRAPTMSKADGTNNQKGNTEEHPESAFRYEYLNGHLIATPTVPVSPVGLPLRPDQPVCKYYSRFGLCKYGVGCQFDHPVNYGSLIAQSRQAPTPNDTSRNGSQ